MSEIRVLVKVLYGFGFIPQYKREGDAGFDLHCIEDVVIQPKSTVMVKTGLAFAIPEGFEMQLRMRSGIAKNLTLFMPNAPGTIDSGYRGEVCVLLTNWGDEVVKFSQGERIAQGVLAPVAKASFTVVPELPSSERGTGGFGSTGV